jgi:ATP-dependent Clp protease ATP-binding subunit ClpC
VLRRAVQHEVEDRLSEKILQGELNAGDHVHVDYVDGEFTFVTTQREGLTVGAGIGTGPATPDLAITSE